MAKNYLFYERLMNLVKQSGKSLNCIERELGYPRNALHNYKNGTEPSGSRLIEIARHLRVSPEYLIGKSIKTEDISIESFFNILSEQQKFELLVLCQSWVLSQIDMSDNK